MLERPGGSDDLTSDSQNKDDMLKKQGGWTLFESLSSSPSIAPMILESSAWIELLGILVGYSEFTKVWIARVGAAKILSRLLWDPKTGHTLGMLERWNQTVRLACNCPSRYLTFSALNLNGLPLASLLGHFLPTSLIVVLKEEGPETMLNLFDGESDTPELIWDSTMRGELRNVAGVELDSIMEFRRETGSGKESFSLSPGVRVKYSKLENELFIGRVYVTRFLKEPTFNVRDPTSFLEALLNRWTHELQICTENEVNSEEKVSSELVIGEQDKLQPATDAIVYLCKIRPSLCDKLTQWGYMSRCLAFLETILSRDLLGYPLINVIRVLHVAANRRVNVESIIASGSNDRIHGIIAFTIRAVGDTNLHPDAGFILEMLKKIFVDALGDVEKAAEIRKSGFPSGVANPMGANGYTMAPSPAPGEDPVSRNRVRVTAGDDPLGLGGGFAPGPSSMANQQTGQYVQATNNHNQAQMMGMTSPLGHMGQMAYSQTANIQNYNQGFQQQQYQSYSSQNMYGSVQNPPGAQQPYHLQTQQTLQPPHINQQYVGRQIQQQQSTGTAHSHFMSSDSAYQNFNSQANVQQQSIGTSYTQNMPQQKYNSQGNSYHFSNNQQENYQGPPSGTMQGKATHTGYNSNSEVSANMAYQPQMNPNNMNARISWQNSGQNTLLPPGSQTLQSNQALAPQQLSRGSAPQNSSQTLPVFGSNATPGTSSQVSSGQFQAQPAISPHQQTGTSQTSAGMLQQNNQVQAQTMYNNVVPQQHQQDYNQQQQNGTHQGSNQPQGAAPNVPIVETVTDVNQQTGSPNQIPVFAPPTPQQEATQQNLPSNEGTGIDARSQVETPSMQAAKAAETIRGAPGCADGRRALLESALRCELPKYLVESVLENPNLRKVKDPASAKVRVIELLKLLTQDPGFGLKFKLELDKSPAWKKYVSQDHSLFITGHEQKADYFLTDGSSSMEAKKLLTED